MEPMSVRFLHTADWQLGKRFGSVGDSSKQEALRSARFQAIDRLADLAGEQNVDFVLVAGDLFDSPTVSKSIVSLALGKIGEIRVPVYVIPGNHDHGGPGSIWDSGFYHEEQKRLAPNLEFLREAEAVLADKAAILPCPLIRRHVSASPLLWLAAGDAWKTLPPGLPRIVLAHGTVQEFGSARDEEDDAGTVNFLDLSVLEQDAVDYIALGDWHGAKQVGAKAWYAGALEPDRFPKGDGYVSGQALLVEIPGRGEGPKVTALSTGQIRWHEIDATFHGPEALANFEGQLQELLGGRVQQDALRLHLRGGLSLEDDARLTSLLERYEARLLRFDLRCRPGILPSEDEIRELAGRSGDPLISAVAARLQEQRQAPEASPTLAVESLRQLFACVRGLESGGKTS